MTKYTEINGVYFETIKSDKTEAFIKRQENPFNRPINIYECYNKPSKSKLDIYDYWLDWFNQSSNVYAFGITSYNTFSFTIGAILFDEETGEDIGFIQITKCHNRLYIKK